MGLTIFESAAALGRYRYVELACFALLGERAGVADPGTAGFLSAASRAHAYRAGLFEARLPVSAGLPDGAALTVSPGAAFDEFVATLGSLEDEALVAGLVERTYPAFVTAYGEHLALCSPATDGGVARALRRAIADLEAVRAEAPPVAPDARAEGDFSRLELERSGGIFGPLRP